MSDEFKKIPLLSELTMANLSKRAEQKKSWARKKYRESNAYREALLMKSMARSRLNVRVRKRKVTGHIYFFESVTSGFYKVGCTTNWKKRRTSYQGPSSIKRVILFRPHKNMFYAEAIMRYFLLSHGYERYSPQGDWFVRTLKDLRDHTDLKLGTT
jgi:hypothetical protein